MKKRNKKTKGNEKIRDSNFSKVAITSSAVYVQIEYWNKIKIVSFSLLSRNIILHFTI